MTEVHSMDEVELLHIQFFQDKDACQGTFALMMTKNGRWGATVVGISHRSNKNKIHNSLTIPYQETILRKSEYQ